MWCYSPLSHWLIIIPSPTPTYVLYTQLNPRIDLKDCYMIYIFFQQSVRSNYFSYTVKDTSSSNDYDHQETSDGKVVSGSYHVLLPDGRLQIVNYKVVDGHSGFVAQAELLGYLTPTYFVPT